MEKIELRIMGGLGNQLYQYSAARFIQNQYQCPRLVIDIGKYDTYKLRNLEINHLIHNETVSFENIKSARNTFYRESYHVYQKIYREITKKRPGQKIFCLGNDAYVCSYIEFEPVSHLDYEVIHMYGYFVSSRIALKMRNELMKEIVLGDGEKSQKYYDYAEQIADRWSIAVSIRCADDYVRHGWPVCSKEFYQKGIEYIIKNRENKSNAIILVFADDIEKIKSENWFLSFNNVIYAEELNICECFELMRNCADYVCSNSSFSWWGAFLSYSDNPIKINPNKIFPGDSIKTDNLTFYDQLIYLDYITGAVV